MRRRAFSLVEVLVAITILGVAVVTLFVTFHSGSLEAKIGEDRMKALALAQKELERIKQLAALGRGSLQDFWGDPKKQIKSYIVDDFYNVQVVVEPVRSVDFGKSKAEVGEATVTVSWKRPMRGDSELILTTIIDQAYY